MIPSEVAYCSSENILNNGASKTIPVINARYTAHLDQGVYLMRFTLSNPVTISNPLKQPAMSLNFQALQINLKLLFCNSSTSVILKGE